jgi:hypothetical protein
MGYQNWESMAYLWCNWQLYPFQTPS